MALSSKGRTIAKWRSTGDYRDNYNQIFAKKENHKEQENPTLELNDTVILKNDNIATIDEITETYIKGTTSYGLKLVWLKLNWANVGHSQQYNIDRRVIDANV